MYKYILLLVFAISVFTGCEDPFYPESEKSPLVKFTDPDSQKWYVKLAVGDDMGMYMQKFAEHEFYTNFEPSKYYSIKEGKLDIAYCCRNNSGWQSWYYAVHDYQFSNGKKYTIQFNNPQGKVNSGQITVIPE